jgi:Zn-dependent peptidase ImmA (M78 family)
MALPYYAAERVLDELGITSPEDLQLLDSIAWERGAVVLYKPLHGAEARLVAVGRRAIITISSLVENPRRRRFGLAHEMGHLELRRQHSSVFLCSSQEIDDWGERKTDTNLEREANEFAAALLLPERFFASLCKREDPSLDLVSRLAEAFDVSLTATALRYLRFCDEVCTVVFSRDGYIEWFQSSEEFERVREDVGLYIDALVV